MVPDRGDVRRQDLASQRESAAGVSYRFDGFCLHPAGASLDLNGTAIHLRHKTFQVLQYLVEQRHRCVPKQELWEKIWEAHAVTEDTLVQSIKDIRRALGDDVRHPRYIRTVPRIGYRFVAPVDEVLMDAEANVAEESVIESPTPAPPPIERRVWWQQLRGPLGVAVLLACVTLTSLALLSRSPGAATLADAAPRRTSVLVLYLTNQSGDEALNWLRHGLADMLISGLSRSDRITVVGRRQLDRLARRPPAAAASVPDVEEALSLARRSHAEAFLRGTFARMGERLRVDVQLHNTATGRIIASESLVAERPEQILSEIDLLSLRLAGQLGEVTRRQPSLPDVMTDSLEAYRYYSLAVDKAQCLENLEALALLEKAVALDPDFAMAHARIGYTYAVAWDRMADAKPYLEKAFNLSSRLTPRNRLDIAAWFAIANYDFAEAIRIYRQIVAASPDDTEAYLHLGRLLLGEGRRTEAMAVVLRGLTVDPASPDLYNALAAVHGDMRQPDRAIEAARRYVSLAPSEANAYDTLALQLTGIGDYAGAETELRRALDINPRFELARVHLANTYVRQGRYADAEREFRRYISTAASDADRARGLEALGDLARRTGKIGDANRLLRESARTAPAVRLPQVLAAIARRDLPFVERARAEIRTRVDSYHGRRGNQRLQYYALGTIALRLGDRDEALAMFREAIAVPPPLWHHDDVETCLGDALVTLGRYQEAVAEYERILAANPNNAFARYGLARAYDLSGNTRSAERQYRTFLDVWDTADSDLPQVKAAARWLAASSTAH